MFDLERVRELGENSFMIISDDGEVEITNICIGEQGEMVISVRVCREHEKVGKAVEVTSINRPPLDLPFTIFTQQK